MIPRYLINFHLPELPSVKCDYLVIGSGIAGLSTAIKASKYGSVILVTKRKLQDSNTEHAQGGIAAAIDVSDSPVLHYKDTVEAGAGLCDLEAVEILVHEGPRRVLELLDCGTNFDREGNKLALTKEGAHSRRRILHANGDATGEEIHRALVSQIKQAGDVTILEDHFVVDLLTGAEGCCGALVMNQDGELISYLSAFTVMASGGAGRLYKNTTNPPVATGDGISMAYRAGADLMDMEFIQFHPTALSVSGAPPFLISEAVRGEGAILLNELGQRFMPTYHPLAELAPRDIVTRAIVEEMQKTHTSRVYLDLSEIDAAKIRKRFPTISETCSRYGVDIVRENIPVAPSAHYMMGGIKTNLVGETNLPRLYACGEAACLGVHGANRLASNSLVDGLVFGARIVKQTLKEEKKILSMSVGNENQELAGSGECDVEQLMNNIQNTMWDKVGILRDRTGLTEAISLFSDQEHILQQASMDVKAMEVKNLLIVGRLVAEAALQRTESRGGHYRTDYPLKQDPWWQKHIVLSKGKVK